MSTTHGQQSREYAPVIELSDATVDSTFHNAWVQWCSTHRRKEKQSNEKRVLQRVRACDRGASVGVGVMDGGECGRDRPVRLLKCACVRGAELFGGSGRSWCACVGARRAWMCLVAHVLVCVCVCVCVCV
jgi:hypothetical protein